MRSKELASSVSMGVRVVVERVERRWAGPNLALLKSRVKVARHRKKIKAVENVRAGSRVRGGKTGEWTVGPRFFGLNSLQGVWPARHGEGNVPRVPCCLSQFANRVEIFFDLTVGRHHE